MSEIQEALETKINLDKALNRIIEIDQFLSKIDIELDEIAGKLEFVTIQEFELSEQISKICDSTYNRNGLYIFELHYHDTSLSVNDWMSQFSDDWKKFPISWVPGIKRIRVSKHKSLKNWIPIYIGKSRKVGNRINEHIIKNIDATTFAMKLKSRTNLYGRKFRVRWIPLDVTNYDMIAPALESKLREVYNPIIGRQ
ncbi:hypothetical protein GCM10011387_31960 [Pedobacter quisquiliarum]|jgi:hypothetical protein|uniref:GIY-YIG domain-containing protein n=1 Tax=Pedobacter quisquiliarum TaxID=1834438 RepID=A0A916UJG5_9SPHI|nr:hypothetical protein [Pedobacter quisquiliarum]GGC75791.1 hypothetical protein GCM10011387_31960 [Pedobacter quisquiliarum]